VNPLLRESAAHVFVESLEVPDLSSDDAHHLQRVLRIRPTDVISVSDGHGRWALARCAGGAVTLEGEIVEEPARAAVTPATVVTAIPKGDRPELIVQKLTELGIDEIVFTTTVRSVVRWDAQRAEGQLARLRRISLEAAMQSRRVRLPSVSLRTWTEVVATDGLAIAEPGGDPVDATVRAIAVGPEGGLTADELGACPRQVTLSDHVLRVETAAIAAAVLLMRAE
jgi:16S rRNA (uracil1498-N3)-methyltransferase